MAEILTRHRDKLHGSVKVIFQPAEERIGGAKQMIAEGALRDPDVEAIIGFHVWNYLSAGKIALRPGAIFASADEMRIVIKGRMGHGALPHQAVDSVVVAAQVVGALQTLISREVAPSTPAVLSIGTIKGGTAFNIIAPEVELCGTIRAFDLAVRDHIVQRAETLVAGICAAMRAEASFISALGCPPCVNDERITTLVREAAQRSLGEDNVALAEPTTGSDDMGYFLQAVPGCYFLVGSGDPNRQIDKPHHTPEFDIDERSLRTAAGVALESILALTVHA